MSPSSSGKQHEEKRIVKKYNKVDKKSFSQMTSKWKNYKE